ncbi:NAD(P)/FAD-dependent oxidoreductase [Rhizobium puerariae]|uniref:NAD(P)/FAD-dependent oxidoreductase n=1 Tax=Rhizobium puerariae TaxID=1585791 RepID=A0ABV6AF46_9HYPH
MGGQDTVLIVGGGQAGGQLARQLLQESFSGRVILASDEEYLPYERPPLSKAVLKGSAAEDSLFLCPAEEWAHTRIEIVASDPVVEIDTGGKAARFASGRIARYDTLVMATGGGPRIPDIPGAEFAKVLRNLEHSRVLRAELGRTAHIAIIGGGVIGMEVAATAAALGRQVTVIEAGARVMGRILPPAASAWLEDLHRSHGATIMTNAAVTRIGPRDTGGFSVQLGDGFAVEADIILMAVGMTPNTALLPKDTIGHASGIVTDEYGRVCGYDGVYAVGDVAESMNPLYGRHMRLETWRNADRQAKAVARTICGIETVHCEVPWMWSDQHERNIQVVGLWQAGADVVVRGACGEPGSSLYWLEDGVVTGGVLIDNGRDRRFLEKMVETAARPSPEALADPAIALKSLV